MRILNFIIMGIFALILSYFLPVFINLFMPLNYSFERVRYSPVIDEFIYSNTNRKDNTKSFKIIGGNEISEDKFLELQPFTNYYVLIQKGKFPQKFKMYENNTSLIVKNSQFLNLKYASNKAKYPDLYVLIEPDELYGRLKYAPFLIRLGSKNGFDVINTDINKIDKNLSENLNKAFLDEGFKLPAKAFFSNPSLMKEFDEGAFVVDSTNTIFHLKFNDNKFWIKNTNITKPNIIKMVISENKRREFYALVITSNEIGLLSYDYKFINLPNDEYEPFKANLNLAISPVDKVLSFTTKEQIKTYVMDLDYNVIKQNTTQLTPPTSSRELKAYVLPFELSIVQDDYAYEFKFINFSAKSVFISVLLAFGFFAYNLAFKKRKAFADSVFIAIFGIYGLIAEIFYGIKKEYK
ncbi:DUF4857 domain-containing protein [Campylobacter sp. faydin G-140]|uniref:DUF4857 domain-containing protein n=1 Tax=Campylobacter anatolicus TaxID=2829105 RepID=UPI001B94DAC5|nr:DUF4857 domain-containing protein [Campylobacter anatolicus]MBR8465520.1 DUF4857 domain-containing protein [Campylobacter anatolicus]